MALNFLELLSFLIILSFWSFTQSSSWSLPILLSLSTTMCLLFYFFTFKPVMLYWMRIKAKLTHIKYSKASFSFYYRIFLWELYNIYLQKTTRQLFFAAAAEENFVETVQFWICVKCVRKKKQPLHRIYMYTYMNEYSNLLIYNAVVVIITWVDG